MSDQEREDLSEETSEEEAMSADPGGVAEEGSDAEPEGSDVEPEEEPAEEEPPKYRPLSGY